ncbi:Nucleic acid-binding, OB-fold [Sesbania bispinosa]|nr:Nucleic acid-binding, OB-fold [Sesbania bispinosa]
MAELVNECVMLKDIEPNTLKLVIKARVNRLWSVPSMKNPLEFNSVEMVLVDSQGFKIQATILRELVNIFQSNIVEEGSYIFCDFDVARNVGSYKPTRHAFKLLLKEGTMVKPTEPDFVVNYCVSPMTNWR